MSDPESAGVAQEVEMKHDDGHEFNRSDVITNPLYDVEQEQEQEQESVASSNQRPEPVADIGETSGVNLPAVNSAQNYESVASQHPEVQNPPLPVMERPEDTLPPDSLNPIPPHVLTRTDTLITSVPMYTHAELEIYRDMNKAGPSNFNAEKDLGFGVTEEEAAETMREVIRESTQKDDKGKAPLVVDESPTQCETSRATVPSNPDYIYRPDHLEASARSLVSRPLIEGSSQTKDGSRSPTHGTQDLEQQGPEQSTNTRAEARNAAPRASTSRWILPCITRSPEQSTNTRAEASSSAPTASNGRWRLPCFSRWKFRR